MKSAYIAVAVVGVVAWLAIGLIFASGPQPEIIVPAEILTKVGPLNISNTLLTSWVVMAIIIVLSLLATRSMKLMPSGLQNFFEGVVGFLLAQMEEIVGEAKARQFFAVVATIFIMIIANNWFGLLPFFNAIGKTEDVGYHIFHELSDPHPHDLVLVTEQAEGGPAVGTYAEAHKFAGWPMEDAGGMVITKPRSKAVDFEVEIGETPSQALDRFIVFLAKNFSTFEATEQDLLHPSAETVTAAAATLAADPKAPQLTTEGHGDGEHGLASAVLGTTVYGVNFENSKKMALVIPFFRGAFSDINNTLAMGIIAFFAIEFWGFKALGFGYLSKFFNLKGIMSFVGILEFLSELIRMISFAFRLFGNIFAGEVLILMLTFLMPFLFVDIIYLLELFVGFIQASVFALLTLVFAGMATESHDEDHGDHAEAHTGGHEATALQGTAQAH